MVVRAGWLTTNSSGNRWQLVALWSGMTFWLPSWQPQLSSLANAAHSQWTMAPRTSTNCRWDPQTHYRRCPLLPRLCTMTLGPSRMPVSTLTEGPAWQQVASSPTYAHCAIEQAIECTAKGKLGESQPRAGLPISAAHCNKKNPCCKTQGSATRPSHHCWYSSCSIINNWILLLCAQLYY